MKLILPFTFALATLTLGALNSTLATEAQKKSAPATTEERASDTADPDTAFLQKAAEINLFEIKFGDAAAKSTDPAIKKLGEKLSKNHQSAQQQLEKLAARKGASLPKQPASLFQERVTVTLKKDGTEFDRAFIQEQIRGHQEAIAFYEKEVTRTTDPEIRAWGHRMLGGLKANLDHVKETLPEAVAEKRKMKKPAAKVRKSTEKQPDLN